MTRELNDIFSQSKREHEVTLSMKEWQELQDELAQLRLQVKNYQGGQVFVYSQMVKLFDKMKEQIQQIVKKQNQFERDITNRVNQLRAQTIKQKQEHESIMTNRVKDLIDKNHQWNKKYAYQLEDLCRSLTMQSEQVWKLNDQVQEIKEDLTHNSTPPSAT